LARLLEPSEFGLIGMLTIFMAISQSFIDSGFGSALIQKKNATKIDESSIFYFNIIIGFIMTGIVFISAPAISNFYVMPILENLTRALSFNLLINSFGTIQISLLTKNLKFKIQAKVNVSSSTISGIVDIICAVSRYGVWSLVVQSILRNLLSVLFYWIFNTWRPLLYFSRASLKSMFRFGSHLLFAGFISIISFFFTNTHRNDILLVDV